ncbi:MAG: metallophosphoesterase family protein [bacterium]
MREISSLMKTAVIADIHGNLPGLQLVLGDIAVRGIGNIICLGDLIEGGQQNNEVVELIRSSHIACIRGNHDDIHDSCLNEENETWLAQLPETMRIDDVIFTHISPRRKQSAITASVEAWNAFEELPFRLCFIGHLHYPALFGQVSDHSCDSRSYDVDAGIFTLNHEDRYIISCGAIGYPRSGGLYLRYGIYDANAHTVEFVKLKGPLLPIGQAKPC